MFPRLTRPLIRRSAVALAALATVIVASRCAPRASDISKASASDIAAAAQKVYVPPGEMDEYYMFASGGHSGQVYVYGVPSMRHISTIPVFTPYPATGYGFDDDSKKMLGNLTWGDVHHPSLSETNGDYDGRWLFVNEMNGRVARIDLRDFKTKQIFGPVAERVRQSRIGVRHAEHRVHDDGVALLDPAPERHLRADRQVRDRLQGRAGRHQDRSEERRDVARLGDPDAAVRLGPRRRRQAGVRRLDVLELVQHRARHRQARGHRVAARSRLHRGGRLARRRKAAAAAARAT